MSRQFFIDCGGYDGCSVRKFRSETDPEAEFTVHSFEPNPALHRHYEGLSNHVLHREAVWDRAGVARLRVDPFVGLNSTLSAGRFASHSALFEDDAPDPPQIQVPCLDLARWMREHLRPTDTIHLKLAVEGVEWDILKGLLRDGTLAWIDRLLLHSGSPDRPPPLTRRRLLREVGRRTAVEAWDASLYAHEHIRPRLFCTVGVDWDLGLLPHWLRHYRRAGVAPADFHVVLNTRFDDNRRVEPARRLLAAADVEASAVWRGTFSSTARLDYKTPFLDALPDDAWVLVVDSDEFHRYPCPLKAMLSYFEVTGIDAVGGHLVDRVAADGRLAAVRPTPSVFEQFPLECDVTGTVSGAKNCKILAHRAWVRCSRSHHKLEQDPRTARARCVPERLKRRQLDGTERLVVDHFKWTADLEARLGERIAHYRTQGYMWFDRSERFLRYYRKHGHLRRARIHSRRARLARRLSGLAQETMRRLMSAGVGRAVRRLQRR